MQSVCHRQCYNDLQTFADTGKVKKTSSCYLPRERTWTCYWFSLRKKINTNPENIDSFKEEALTADFFISGHQPGMALTLDPWNIPENRTIV